jgi:hypothetical protein
MRAARPKRFVAPAWGSAWVKTLGGGLHHVPPGPADAKPNMGRAWRSVCAQARSGPCSFATLWHGGMALLGFWVGLPLAMGVLAFKTHVNCGETMRRSSP